MEESSVRGTADRKPSQEKMWGNGIERRGPTWADSGEKLIKDQYYMGP